MPELRDIETTTTTFSYSTTSTTTLPPEVVGSASWQWKSDHVYRHNIYIVKEGINQHGRIEVLGGSSVVDVVVSKQLENYLLLKVETDSIPSGSFSINYYYSENGVENNLININISLSSTASEDAAVVDILNSSPISVSNRGEERLLEYISYGIDISHMSVQSNTSFVNIAKDAQYPIYTIMASSNNTDTSRSAVVTLSALAATYDDDPDNYVSDTVTVSQTASSSGTTVVTYSRFTPTDINVDASSQTIVLDWERSNIYSTTPSTPYDWLHYSYSLSHYRITVDANTMNPRSGYVLFDSLGKNGIHYYNYVTVNQDAPIVDGTIEIDGEVIVCGYEAGSYSVTFTSTDCNLATAEVTTDDNWLIPTISSGTSTITVTVTDNTLFTERTGKILIGCMTSGGGTLFKSIPVVQEPTVEYMEFPIWKDTDYYINTTDDYINYSITCDGDVVYEGRAFSIDGQVVLRVNDILKDYLNESLTFTEGFQSNSGYKTFTLTVNTVTSCIFRVYNDWSYQEGSGDNIISEVIDYNLDPRQYFVQSYLDKFESGNTAVNISGSRATSTRPFSVTYTVNNDIATQVWKAGNYTMLYVDINESNDPTEYTITDTCKPYCIYWRNMYGGYNYYLLNTTSKQNDKVESFDITVNNNNTPSLGGILTSWERRQYQKNITETWTVKTDILNDRESDIISGIAKSPEIYLHLLDENKVVPVVVVDTQVERKKWRNNNRKFITYQFTLENSNNKKIK